MNVVYLCSISHKGVKENVIRKDDTVKEQFGEVFLFLFLQNDFHSLSSCWPRDVAVSAS